MTRRTPDWTDAACKNNPDPFFPTDHQPGWTPGEALAICGKCPIVDPCQQYALAHRLTDGVWGGTTANQRRRHLGVPTEPECGTAEGYRAHAKLKQKQCVACHKAYLEYRTRLRARLPSRVSAPRCLQPKCQRKRSDGLWCSDHGGLAA